MTHPEWAKTPGKIRLEDEDAQELVHHDEGGGPARRPVVEVGADLISWPGGIVEVGSPVDNGDGTVTRRFRSATPISAAQREFIRLLMEEQ